MNPYRSDKKTMGVLAKICICLTNLKIRNAPMYATDRVFDPHREIEEEEEVEEGGGEQERTRRLRRGRTGSTQRRKRACEE